MRKIFTLVIACFVCYNLGAQTCTATNEATFITCTQTAGVTTINISNSAPKPLIINSTVNISGITLNVPNNFLIIFNGDVIGDAGTTFSGTGMSQIRIAGQTYTGNMGSGNTFSNLNALLDGCTPNPDIGGCSLVDLLPVELTHFAAQPKDNKVELAWTTATELNNDFFQIEHSRDGIQFQAVGKVKGEGTTTETINYHFMHRQPVNGTNYYRLKQVDYDGAFEYSEVVVADVNTRTGGIQIYPNPTIDKAVIQMTERPEQIKFQLYNLVGKRIDRPAIPSDLGWEIDLTQLPKGIYLLRLEYAGKTVSKRIVKE